MEDIKSLTKIRDMLLNAGLGEKEIVDFLILKGLTPESAITAARQSSEFPIIKGNMRISDSALARYVSNVLTIPYETALEKLLRANLPPLKPPGFKPPKL